MPNLLILGFLWGKYTFLIGEESVQLYLNYINVSWDIESFWGDRLLKIFILNSFEGKNLILDMKKLPLTKTNQIANSVKPMRQIIIKRMFFM